MEKAKYVCVFEDKQCPVKVAWKLSPESLSGFCRVCIDKSKWDSIMKAVEMISTMQKNTSTNETALKLQKELDLEKAHLNHQIEMRKMDLEEKKFEVDKKTIEQQNQ